MLLALHPMAKTKWEPVLVTGACGYVGKFLTDLLLSSGYKQLILGCRNNDRHVSTSEVVYTPMDLSDKKSIVDIFKHYKPKHILHLGAVARLADGERDPNHAYRVNFMGTRELVNQAILNKVKTFVFVSTDLARDHKSVVGITKYLGEWYIQQVDPVSTCLVTIRIPNVAATPGSVHLIFQRLINENKPITITHPEMSRRFITGKEAASFILYALEHPQNKGTFIVDKSPLKITELASEMIAASGKDIGIEYIGIRPGEKLAERGYEGCELQNTSMEYLSLLSELVYDDRGKRHALQLLKSKPGFTMDLQETD
jgi:UDP-N-acetyl-D-glucosamine 4,6-dehydratase